MQQVIRRFFMGLMAIHMGCAADHKVMLGLAPKFSPRRITND